MLAAENWVNGANSTSKLSGGGSPLLGPAGGPDFAADLPLNGYTWWYADALSDDGQHGLTIIAMLGNVFSPYYATARRRGPAEPLNYSALNAAFYGRGGKRWAMTERGHRDVHRETHALAIGPSAMRWSGETLVIDIDEITVPVPSRLQGRVKITPETVTTETFTLNSNGQHLWRPIAPVALVEVALTQPALTWRGHAYVDCNRGDAPLETGFECWDWSRSNTKRDSKIFYDTTLRGGAFEQIALSIDRSGTIRAIESPPRVKLPGTLWRIERKARTDSGTTAEVIATLEDTPFYARSRITSVIHGEPAEGVHESLSLDRFASRWVQALLPFRLPRRAR